MPWSRLGRLVLPLVLWLAAAAWAEVPVPSLAARVTDLTGTLAPDQRSALEGGLREIEGRNGSQIAVLLVPTTQPEAIEQYSMRVAEAWRLGRQGADNGLLLLVAKNDRKLRIEVGYGLEGVVPDAVARRVIDETITPRFREGDFHGGLTAGVQQLAGLIDGGGSSGVAETGSLSKSLIDEIREVPTWLIFLLVAVGTALRWLLGPLFGGLAMGGLVGGGTWLVSGVPETAILTGVFAFIFVLVGLANWIALGSGGGSGSSGSSGSSGFSGGGGSFGGGGASGSW